MNFPSATNPDERNIFRSPIETVVITQVSNLSQSDPVASLDGCDLYVPCADSTLQICVTQQCDGTNDCPNADDEDNCPYKKGNEQKELTQTSAVLVLIMVRVYDVCLCF